MHTFTGIAQYSWFEGSNLNSVAQTHPQNGVAVGGGLSSNHKVSKILKTTDSGKNWDIQTKNATLYAVSFSDNNIGTAVGDWGTIIRTSDGGETWEEQSSGVATHLRGVYFSDANTGTTVGLTGRILRTTNGGQDWVNQSTGIFNVIFNDVYFFDVNNGWVVGTGGNIHYTSDGGANWILQNSGTTHALNSVVFSDFNNGIVVGDNGLIIKTTDAGLTWVIYSNEINNHLYDIAFAGGVFTIVGDRGLILRSSDSGITWNVQTSGTTNRLNGVSFYDSNNGTAVGWFGTVLITADGGVTWQSKFFNYVKTHNFIYNGNDRTYYVFLPPEYTRQSKFPMMLVLNGHGGTGQVAQEASRMSSVADTSGFIVVYPNPVGDAWSLGGDVAYMSALIDTVNSYYNIDLSRVYVCGYSFGGYMSHSLGCQLSHRIAAIAPVAGTINFSTMSDCNVAASPPVFYLHGTLDDIVPYNGVQPTLNFWIGKNNANASIDSVAIPDIDTTDGSTIMKYLYRNNQGVARVVFYKVINGGHNWPGTALEYTGVGSKNMDINTSEEIWNFVKDFQLDLSGLDYEYDHVINDFYLFQNYPNPFNPSTTISWQSPVGGHQTLKIYDLLGREVAVLVDEYKPAGSYEVKFDASHLSSGTYFYRLQAGEFIKKKKLILLK